MRLTYNNNLSKKTDSKFLARNTLTNLNRVRQNDNRQFEFSLTFEEVRIVEQAQTFANYVSALGLFENSFLNNSNRVPSAVNVIADAYVYSYIKSVFYAYHFSSNSSSSIMGPGSNTVFYGHKIMHDIICEGYIQHFTPPSNVISLELNPPKDTLEQLEKFSIWDKVFDSLTGRVFNPELETVLTFLNNKCDRVVALGSISSGLSINVKNLMELPIGNLAFSPSMQQLLYVEDESLSSDKPSYYWNKAVLITAISVPEIDADDSVYDTILEADYDPSGITFEVQAITGFSPLSNPRNVYDYTTTMDPSSNSPSPPRSGYNPNSRGGNPNAGRGGGSGRGRGGNNPRANQNTKLNMARSNVGKVTNNVVTFIRRVDEALTPDKVDLVADVIQTITGKRPKIKTLRQLAGQQLGKVFEQNGIRLRDNLAGSNEEYDAIYTDSEYINGI